MTIFRVELDVMNSGSRNDIPAKGAASECYICFTPTSGDSTTLRVGNFSNNNFTDGDIKNGGTYVNFVDIAHRNANTQSIDLPENDTNLMVGFSIYFGMRWFDALISQAVQSFLTAQAGPLITEIVGKAPTFLQDLAKNKLTAKEKSLLASFDKNVKQIVFPVGFGQFGQINPSTTSHVIPIVSVVDVVHDDFVGLSVIKAGDLVANLILTKS